MNYRAIYGANDVFDPPENMVCKGTCEIPSSLSNLTALTSLEAHYNIDVPDLDFDRLSQLSSLQHLSVRCSSKAGAMALPNSLTTLSHLTPWCTGIMNNRAAIVCDFDWGPFHLLQHVTFAGHVPFYRDLSEFTSLRSLQAVELTHVRHEGPCVLRPIICAYQHGMLLRQHRSDVLLNA